MNNAAQGNFRQDELDRFASLANRWWDPDGPQKPLHALNPARLGYVATRVPLRGASVLDVGCGGGLLSEALAREGAEVTAIDLSPELVDVARLHLLESDGLKVDYRLQAVEALADDIPGHFDAVTCMEMLEHVPDPASIVAACARLVKPGGHVFLSTLNRNPKSYLFAIVGAEYLLKLLPAGTHEYARFIKPSELSRHCRNARLDVQEIIGLSYNPLAKTYSLGRDTDVNYLVHTVAAG